MRSYGDVQEVEQVEALGEGERTVRYGFGDFILDTQRYELRQSGASVPLGP